MNFDMEIFSKFDFSGSQIIWHHNGGVKEDYFSLHLKGSFKNVQYKDCKFWCISFDAIENKDSMTGIKFMGCEIEILEICRMDELFHVKMIIANGDDTKELSFHCKRVNPGYYRYMGMSYRNLYGTEEYRRSVDKWRYVLDEKYFTEKEEFTLSDGYSLETLLYEDMVGQMAKARLTKGILKKSGKPVFEYLNTDDRVKCFTEFILHSNGRRYFPYHVDLYGISYIDVDSLEAYNYVPEGYEHDFSYCCGESFIITDIHYDKNTNLIAYGGCYWAGPSDVMVGDFSEPLNFNPRYFDISEIIDPDSEGYDIDFKQWNDNQLVVTLEYKEEKYISIEEIINRIPD